MVLVAAFWSLCAIARAQGSSEVYAAPGMAVRLQCPVLPVPRKPLAATPLSPILARFWNLPDSVMSEAARPFFQFAGSHIKYPANSLRAGVSGKISATLIVLANGAVSQVRITKRELVEEGGPGTATLGVAALDAELTRVLKALRFEPSARAKDSVSVTQAFSIQ